LDVFGSGIIGRINGTSTNNAYLGFASAGTNKWSVGNVQSDHRFRIFSEANSAELITILQTGEFGIGIANPLTKLHIDGGATALIANLDANVSVAKSLSFRSDNSNRINLEVSGTESGSNAGADFFIRRYSDAGSLIDTPLTLTRSTGEFTLAKTLNGTSASFSSANIPLALNITGVGNTNISFSENGTLSYYIRAVSTGGFSFYDNRIATETFALSSTGAANFSSSVTANSFITRSTGGVGSTTWSLLHDQTLAGDFGIYNPSGSKIYINSSGYVGLGNSTPAYNLDVLSTAQYTARFNSSAAQGGFAAWANSGTAYGYIGNAYHIVGGGSVGDMAMSATANMVFGTGSTLTERMRITGVTGQTLIGGHTSSTYPARLSVKQFTGDPTVEILSSWAGDVSTAAVFIGKFDNNNTTSQIFMKFVIGNVSVANGQINGNGAAQVAFGSWSDKRLKENIINIPSQLSNILALRPVEFDYINGSGHQTGFIAQEMQEVFPDSVGETEEGYLTITGWNKTEAILVKAIQELKQELDELKAKIN
jgi:hypothetical protein